MPKVGIVITNGHLFSNGMNQNAIFLYFLILKMGIQCDLLSYDESFRIIMDIPVKFLTSSIVSEYSTIITVSTGLDKHIFEACEKSNTQVIGYVCSNQLCMAMEETATARSRSSIVGHDVPIHKAWVFDGFPFMKTYVELMRRVKAEYVPHLWNSSIMESYCKFSMKKEPSLLLYTPSNHISNKMTILISEANINFVKTAVVPLLAAEKLYSLNPHLIQEIFIFSYPTDSTSLSKMISNLRCGHLVRKFIRQVIPGIMYHFNSKDSVPVFVAHQIHTPLNYSYYETMYYGFPFVHNSPRLKDYGNYYSDLDIDLCAIQILKAFQTHATEFEERLAKNRTYLESIDPTHPSCYERWRPILSDITKRAA